jgi:hypothetical protein
MGVLMLKRTSLACITTAVVLSFASPALAEPSLADRETARSLMDEGDRKRDAGDLKGALKSYEAADAIMHVPTTGIEVARTQIALGMLLEARETLGRILRSPVKPNEPAPFTAARKAADTLNAELGPRIPAIQVVIQNADQGQAQISIDNEQIPPAASSVPRKVNPGAHVVLVKVGSADKQVDVMVAEGETKTVTVDFADLRPPEPSSPQDQGSGLGVLPKVLMFGGFGLGAVGIGVGAVTGLMSIAKTNDLQKECPENNCPRGYQSRIDEATGLGNISTAAFIVGGVGVAAGVVGIILSNNEKKEPTTPAAKSPSPFGPDHVRAVLGPSYVGLAGAF